MANPSGAGDVVEAICGDPGGTVVGLDVDGTLAPIVARPEDSRLAPGAETALRTLAARLGGVALISGRAALDVVRLAGVDEAWGIRVLGHYGLQEWSGGELRTPPPAPGVATARKALPEVLAAAAHGVYVEDKEHSLVVHTRPAEHPQRALDQLAPALRALAVGVGLEAVPGRFVLELRPPGVDKGVALRGLVAEAGARIAVYAGDDVGDLPAYSALDELAGTGIVTLKVASAPAGDIEGPAALRQRADLALDGPAGVVAWLGELVARLG